MTPKELPMLVGHILEEQETVGFEELCRYCSVEHSFVVELVDQGIIDAPATGAQRFSGKALQRVRLAMRLQRDLGINAAGSALVIELLERIQQLERE